jgi:transcriptional regulator with XRE-family HTH domain
MNYQEIGKALSHYREERGLTQTKLAELTGISRATINSFENGRGSDIGVKKLMGLLAVLGQELTVKPKSSRPTLDELQNEW